MSDGVAPDTPRVGPLSVPAGWETPDVQADQPGAPQPTEPIGMFTNPGGTPADPGTDDKMESTVAGAVAAANARLVELAGDSLPMGATIGDLMTLPDPPGAASKMEGPPAGY